MTSVRVVVGTPALQKAKKKEMLSVDILGTRLRYKKTAEDLTPYFFFWNWAEWFTIAAGHFEIVGRTPDLFQAKHRIDFTPDTQFPVDIRITRNLQEYRDDDIISDTLNWYDYTERIGRKDTLSQ